MTKNLKISLSLVAAAVVALGLLLVFDRSSGSRSDAGAGAGGGGTASPGAAAAPSSRLVRPDSHRLSTAKDGRVTVVEFLDLECESCRAAFPVVERLRKEYEGRVTFVVRYFPIPSHRNAELAARVVESAAAQGKFEAMYARMYETQEKWGERQDSQEATFRGFARDLGLDMAAFDKALKDPATAERVDKDRRDGLLLGVRGTPTFFVNGKRPQITSYEDFKAAIDAELAQ
ncbi:DsbA family protein [Spirillospora sp. NPDC127200]